MIIQKLKEIKEGKLTAQQNIKNFIDKIKKENSLLNAVLVINEHAIEQAKEVDKKIKNGNSGKLAGLGFIVKSNINVLGLVSSCASKTLENYKATYNATAVQKLLNEDAIVLGIANMDEFACGSSGETSAFGITKNPSALDRIPGGSSSGSAASLAAGFCDFSLGSDTGGSIRNPASHTGIVGYKPSYGAVSRFGLIDLSMSLDQIGPLAKKVEDCEIIYNIIKGKDENDASSVDITNENKDIKKIKIGIPKIKAEPKIWELVKRKTDEISKENNWKTQNIELEHIDLGIQTYYLINYVEFFSGTRRFDGRKYGKKIEENCGEEVLRRILGGLEISKAEFAGKYYRKALLAKKVIEHEFNKAFESVDCIIIPTVPRLPHKLGEKISIEDMYNYDSLTVLANLAEIPAISIPVGKIDSIPVGMQIICKKDSDSFLFDIAKKFE
jgi:aspartyl-tRNA(Asn)/glutamyl-tRNA(Gln) amidotransferase subunit A